MTSKKTSFQDEWLRNPKYEKYIRRIPDNTHAAQCVLCHTTFGLSNMGRSALDSHMTSKKHQKAVEVINSSCSIRMFRTVEETKNVSCNQNVTNTQETNEQDVILDEPNDARSNSMEATNVNKRVGLSQFLIKQEVLRAEIMWAMAAVMFHIPLSSAGKCTELFSAMFPTSPAASGMQLGRAKLAYVIAHGLAPYFLENLLNKACESEAIVIFFDESFNKILKATQMDIAIGFWDKELNNTCVRYYTSSFLGHTRASDILQAFLSILVPFMLNKLLNISIDGPNVNLKFLKDLKIELNSRNNPESRKFLFMGSCGLHTCHNSFKEGAKATNWKIDHLLRAIYYFFKNSSARRNDYIQYSGSEEFGLKFCSVRWLCNREAAERAIKILPNLKQFVAGVRKDNKENSIKAGSYETIKNCLEDKLLDVKLTFFAYIAGILEPFLKEFQTTEPLAPLLFSTLEGIIVDIMKIFVKKEVLETSTNIAKIDLNCTNNLKVAANINFDDSFSVNSALKKAKTASPKEILIFKNDCRTFLKVLCIKLLEKSPLKYELCKGISCCDPFIIVNRSSSTISRRLNTALNCFSEGNWLSSKQCDKIKKEFLSLIAKPGVKDSCKHYSKSKRLNNFWMSILNANNASSEMKEFMKLVLLISHGNAFVERGFSINKEMIIENQKKNSLIAFRQVYDGIVAEGGIKEVKITKKMIDKVQYSRREYIAALENEKKLVATTNENAQKKRQISEQLKELQEKRRKITLDHQMQAASIDDEIEILSSKLD